MKKVCLISIIILLLLSGCKKKTYTVTFMDEDTKLSSIKVNKGASIKEEYVPKKDGYIFVSWLKDGLEYDPKSPVNEDITLTANWTTEPTVIKNYTITFNFGDHMKTQTVASGEKVPRPKEDPVKEKHTFLGWYVGETLYDFELPVEKDIVLVAKYEKNRIIITYDLNGGTGTAEVEIDKDSIPEKPKDPEKYGYTFTGWLLDGKPYYFDFPLTENTTIKANWVATEYVTVNFNTDGGGTIKSEVVVKGTSLASLPTPTKEGYTFKYWSLKNTEFDIKTKITENITLVAIYEQIPEVTPEPTETPDD